VEVGSGYNPRPGYLHVDVRSGLPDLDVVAPADQLPFPDDWADEILAVHMIEHVPAGALPEVLAGWRRQLRPGGRLMLHTPNGASLGTALVRGDVPPEVAWAVQSAIFGYDRAPWDASSPEAVGLSPDHKLLFTPSLLQHALESAGFVGVKDVSGQDTHCQHSSDWQAYVPGLCLEMSASAPTAP
jgi:SAM-dependent methyltransferase